MEDYNKKYYEAAVKAIQHLSHYYSSLKNDVAAYLKHYISNPDEELLHAIDWAIADTFGGGCELEIY